MSATEIKAPFEIFFGATGAPLQAGNVYIGTVNQNPETNPVTVYWDSALTIPAQQPVRTSGGYFYRSGTPSSLFITGSYSITVKDKNGVLIFNRPNVPAAQGTGSGFLAEGLQSVQITDLNFDPTLLGLVVREIRGYTTSSSPSNPPAGSTATYWTLILSFPATGEYRLVAYPNGSTQNIYTRTYVGGVWSSWQTGGGAPILLTTGSSPYSLVAGTTPELIISATTNPYIVNLPSATASGYRIRIVNTSTLNTGLIKIVPSAGQRIGPNNVNVACYLQNLDQAGWEYPKQYIELMDVLAGVWAVVGGQFMPEPGSVDNPGTQYFLGKLRHLPLGNNTSRNLVGVLSVSSGVFTAAQTAVGVFGIPTGAKAIRAKIKLFYTSTGAGATDAGVYFSDNNSNAASQNTSHPGVSYAVLATGAGNYGYTAEIDIPLNSSGQFFAAGATYLNVSAVAVSISLTGYYMGD